MAYSAGRLQIYVDYDTAKEDYTTAIYDSMTEPLVAQLCNIFDMVVFTDLTETTSKGHRYFIGHNNAEYPSYAVGWATGYTQTNTDLLLIVGLFQGSYLSNALNEVTSSISNSQYHIILIQRDFNSSYIYYHYCNFIHSELLKGVSPGFRGTATSQTSSEALYFINIKLNDTKKIAAYNNRSSRYYSYDISNDGRSIIVNPSISYGIIKGVLANDLYNYISQIYVEMGQEITGLFIYSSSLTTNKIFKINGEYYYCIYNVGGNEGSWIFKLTDYAS